MGRGCFVVRAIGSACIALIGVCRAACPAALAGGSAVFDDGGAVLDPLQDALSENVASAALPFVNVWGFPTGSPTQGYLAVTLSKGHDDPTVTATTASARPRGRAWGNEFAADLPESLRSIRGIASMSGGTSNTCILDVSGRATCFARSPTAADLLPNDATDPFVAVSSQGEGLACGLAASGQLRCAVESSQSAFLDTYFTPPPNATYASLAMGRGFLCGLRAAAPPVPLVTGGVPVFDAATSSLAALGPARPFPLGGTAAGPALGVDCWINAARADNALTDTVPADAAPAHDLVSGYGFACSLTSPAAQVSCWGAQSEFVVPPTDGLAGRRVILLAPGYLNVIALTVDEAATGVIPAASSWGGYVSTGAPPDQVALLPPLASADGGNFGSIGLRMKSRSLALVTTTSTLQSSGAWRAPSSEYLLPFAAVSATGDAGARVAIRGATMHVTEGLSLRAGLLDASAAAAGAARERAVTLPPAYAANYRISTYSSGVTLGARIGAVRIVRTTDLSRHVGWATFRLVGADDVATPLTPADSLLTVVSTGLDGGWVHELTCGNATCCVRAAPRNGAGMWTPPQSGTVACSGASTVATTSAAFRSVAISGDCVLVVRGSGATTGGPVEILSPVSDAACPAADRAVLLPPEHLSNVTFLHIAAERTGSPRVVCGLAATGLPGSATGAGGICWGELDTPGWGELARVPALVATSDANRLIVVAVSSGRACAAVWDPLRDDSHDIFCWGRRPGLELTLTSPNRIFQDWDEGRAVFALHPYGHCVRHLRHTYTADFHTLCFGAPPGGRRYLRSEALARDAVQLSVAGDHVCALAASGAGGCAGLDGDEQASVPQLFVNSSGASPGAGFDNRTVSLMTAPGVTCALSAAGSVACSGDAAATASDAASGALTGPDSLPAQMPVCDAALLSPAELLVVNRTGADVAMSLTTGQPSGRSSGWLSAALGGPASRIVAYQAGERLDAACAMDITGAAVCLTRNRVSNSTTLHVPPPGSRFLDVCATLGFFVGLHAANRSLVVWGATALAKNVSQQHVPHWRGPFYGITCGHSYACAVDASRSVVCFPPRQKDIAAYPNILPAVVPANTSMALGSPAGAVCLLAPVTYTPSTANSGSGGASAAVNISCFGDDAASPLYARHWRMHVADAGGDGYRLVALGPWRGIAVPATASGRAALLAWGDDFPLLPSLAPQPTSASNWSAVAVGWRHACAVDGDSGSTTCWGDPSENRTAPAASAPPAVAVVAGAAATCVVTAADQSLQCWGANIDSPTAARNGSDGTLLQGFSSQPSHMCAGRHFACAWLPGVISVACFDVDTAPAPLHILDGSVLDQAILTPAGGLAKLSCGAAHVCVLGGSGSLRCAGVGPDRAPPAALAVPTGAGGAPLAWADVSASFSSTCGVVASSRRLLCWGTSATGNADGNPWPQGTVRVRSRASSPSGSSGGRTVSIGGAMFTAEACAVNLTCSDVYQAARYVAEPFATFLLPPSTTLTAPLLFHRGCYRCTLAAALSSGAVVLLPTALPPPLDAPSSGPAAAVIIQSSFTLANVSFTVVSSSGSGGSGVSASSTPLTAVVHAAVQATDDVMMTGLSFSAVPSRIAAVALAPSGVASTAAGSLRLMNTAFNRGTGQVLAASSAAAVTITNLQVDLSANATVAAPLLQFDSVAAVAITGVTLRGGAAVAGLIESFAVDSLSVVSLTVTNASLAACVRASECGSVVLRSCSVTDAVLGSLVLAPVRLSPGSRDLVSSISISNIYMARVSGRNVTSSAGSFVSAGILDDRGSLWSPLWPAFVNESIPQSIGLLLTRTLLPRSAAPAAGSGIPWPVASISIDNVTIDLLAVPCLPAALAGNASAPPIFTGVGTAFPSIRTGPTALVAVSVPFTRISISGLNAVGDGRAGTSWAAGAPSFILALAAAATGSGVATAGGRPISSLCSMPIADVLRAHSPLLPPALFVRGQVGSIALSALLSSATNGAVAAAIATVTGYQALDVAISNVTWRMTPSPSHAMLRLQDAVGSGTALPASGFRHAPAHAMLLLQDGGLRSFSAQSCLLSVNCTDALGTRSPAVTAHRCFALAVREHAWLSSSSRRSLSVSLSDSIIDGLGISSGIQVATGLRAAGAHDVAVTVSRSQLTRCFAPLDGAALHVAASRANVSLSMTSVTVNASDALSGGGGALMLLSGPWEASGTVGALGADPAREKPSGSWSPQGEAPMIPGTAADLGAVTSVTLSSSAFSGATSGSMGGGAIAIMACNPLSLRVLNGTRFSRNTARRGTFGETYGGAVFIQQRAPAREFVRAAVRVQDSLFTGNSAACLGGAIAVMHDSGLQLDVVDSVFASNVAVQTSGFQACTGGAGGGAIWHALYRATSFFSASVQLQGVNASDNAVDAGSHGGFAYFQLAEVLVTGGSFLRNSAGQRGGAIYTSSCRVRIEGGTVFASNLANGTGGAVMLQGGFRGHQVYGASFSFNRALGGGGAIAVSSAPLTLYSTSFHRCASGTAGGGLYVTGSESLIDLFYVQFTGCSACIEVTSPRSSTLLAASSGSGAAGGAVGSVCAGGCAYVADAQSFTALFSSFTGCWAGAAGGALAFNGVGQAELTDVKLSQGSAGRSAIQAASAAGVTNTLPASAAASVVGLGGGILAAASSRIGLYTLSDSSQVLNCSAELGGGMAIVGSSSAEVAYLASIRGCNASIAGGAAYLDMTGSSAATASAGTNGDYAAAVSARLAIADEAVLADNSVAAGGYGPNLATTAVGMVMLEANGTAAATTASAVVAVVEPGTIVSDPLFRLQLRDALGAVAAADSATCILSAVDSTATPPAAQQLSRTVFASVAGVVTVSGLAVLAAPGTPMNLSLSCLSTGSRGLAGSFDAAVFTRPARAATVLVVPALPPSVIRPMLAHALFNTPLPELLLYIVREDGAGGFARIRSLRVAAPNPDTACDFYAGLTQAGSAAAAASSGSASSGASGDASWRVITKKQAAPFSENGTLSFADVTLQPLAEHAGLSAALRVACSFRGVQLPDVTFATTFDAIELRWRTAPPNSTLPSTSTPIAGRGLSLQLWRRAKGAPLRGDSATTRCDVSIDAASQTAAGYTNASISSSSSTGFSKPVLYGSASAEADANGIVSFANLALDAPFGSIVPLLIQCKRSAGDPEDPTMRLNLSIPAVDISWVQPPPPEVLGLTPFEVSAALKDRSGTVLASLAAAANSSAASGISCTLSVSGAATLVAAAATDYIRSPDENGFIAFPRVALKPVTAAIDAASRTTPRVATLQLACQLGQQWAPPLVSQLVLPALGLMYLRPPPLSWLPATPSLRSPVLPSPLLTLVDSTGRPVRVDRGVTCEATLRRTDAADVHADDTQLLSIPAGGFSFASAQEALQSADEAAAAGGRQQLVFNRNEAVWNASLSPWMASLPRSLAVMVTPPTASDNSADAADVASRFGYSLAGASSTAPSQAALSVMAIALRPLTPQVAALAATMQLCVRCALSVDDPSDELCLQRRITAMGAVLLQPGLPQALQPGAVFNVSVALVDREALGAAAEAAVSTSGAGGVALSAVSHALLHQDDDTTCSLTLPSTTTSASGGSSGGGSGVDNGFARVVAGTPRAAGGLLFFDAVTVLVAPGRTVSVAVACSRGGLAVPVLPRPLQPVAIATCRAGYFVSPALSCEVCGENTHRDHGAAYEWARNTTTCERCPPRLSVCTEGRVTLLNGFYVAPISIRPVAPNASAALIDDKLEVHDCPRKEACTVNETARTFDCAAGYSGPFCAVCADGYANAGSACEPCNAPGLGVFLATLLPIGILGLGLWAASRRITDADPSAPLTRIVLSYLQFMGTLLGSFVAQGSARVRETFGFAQSVGGGGPLSLHPLACVTHWNFYERFGLTASLPLLMMASTLLGHRILRAYAARKDRKRSGSTIKHASSSPATAVMALPSPSVAPALVRNPLAADASASSRGEAGSPVVAAARGTAATATTAAAGTAAAGAQPKQQQSRSRLAACASALVNPLTIGPLVFVLTLTMSAVLDSSFAILDCWPDPVTVAPGVRATYLSRDMSLQCGGALHTAMSAVAVAVILLLGAGAPIAFACLLVRRRRDLHTPSIFSAFGFLYQGYMLDRPHRFAYETAVIFRKVAVVAVAALVKDALTQLLAASLLLSSSLAVLFWARPYALVLWTVVDGISLYVLLVTALATVSLLKAQTAAAQCLGLSDSQVPTGLGAQTCGELRSALAATDASTTSSLLLLNGALIIAFAVLATRLRCIASVRRRRLAQLAAATAPLASAAALRPGLLTRALAAANDALERSLCGGQGAASALCCSGCSRHGARSGRSAVLTSVANDLQSQRSRQAAEEAIEARATAQAAAAAAAVAAAAATADGAIQIDGASDTWGTAKLSATSTQLRGVKPDSSLQRRSVREAARSKRLITAAASLPSFADPFLLTAEASLTIDKRAAARGRNCLYRALCRCCSGLRWLDMPLHRACEASELLSAVLRGKTGADDLRSAIAERASLRKASYAVLSGTPGGQRLGGAPSFKNGGSRAATDAGGGSPLALVMAASANRASPVSNTGAATSGSTVTGTGGVTSDGTSAGAGYVSQSSGGARGLGAAQANRLIDRHERAAMPALPTAGVDVGATSPIAHTGAPFVDANSAAADSDATVADAAPSLASGTSSVTILGQPSDAVRRMARLSRRTSQAAALAGAAAALAIPRDGERDAGNYGAAATGSCAEPPPQAATATVLATGLVGSEPAGSQRRSAAASTGSMASGAFAAPPAPAAPRLPPALTSKLLPALSIPRLVRRTSGAVSTSALPIVPASVTAANPLSAAAAAANPLSAANATVALALPGAAAAPVVEQQAASIIPDPSASSSTT